MEGAVQHGAAAGALELRREPMGGVRLRASFPFNSRAVLSDGGRSGRPVKEEFAPGAFDFSINEPDAEIHLLVGHSFDWPLASKKAGTLWFKSDRAALTLTAVVVPAILRTTYAADAMAQIEAGLLAGVSPGFRMPPERAVPREEAEEIEEEPDRPDKGMHRATIRRIKQAILVEMSLVARPAYPSTSVEATRAAAALAEPRPALAAGLRRWRA